MSKLDALRNRKNKSKNGNRSISFFDKFRNWKARENEKVVNLYCIRFIPKDELPNKCDIIFNTNNAIAVGNIKLISENIKFLNYPDFVKKESNNREFFNKYYLVYIKINITKKDLKTLDQRLRPEYDTVHMETQIYNPSFGNNEYKYHDGRTLRSLKGSQYNIPKNTYFVVSDVNKIDEKSREIVLDFIGITEEYTKNIYNKDFEKTIKNSWNQIDYYTGTEY